MKKFILFFILTLTISFVTFNQVNAAVYDDGPLYAVDDCGDGSVPCHPGDDSGYVDTSDNPLDPKSIYTNLAIGSSYTISSKFDVKKFPDRDYYAIEIHKTGYYQINYSSETSSQFILKNDASTELIRKGTVLDFETIIYLTEGTYPLDVQVYTKVDISRYYSIKFLSLDNNNKINPEPININESINSSIDYVGDVDYYQFTANESGVWGYKVTGILNADISIICNDEDILYSNPLYTYYGSANYQLTNSSFFAFKEGGHYTIKITGSNIGTYSINKEYDIGMQTIELNSKSFSTSVIYSYPGYIDGYQGYQIGYFTTKDKAKLFIHSLSPDNPAQTASFVIGLISIYTPLGPLGFYHDSVTIMDNIEINNFIDYANQNIDEMDSESIYIALRLENGSVNHYQVTICPWDQKTYYYSYMYYYDYTTTTDKY